MARRRAIRDMAFSKVLVGTNSAMTIDDSVSINSACGAGQARSFGIWIKCNKPETTRVVMEKAAGKHFGIQVLATGLLLMGVDSGAANETRSTESICDNKWHRCVCTYDGTTGRVYVDGAEVASETGWTAPADNASDLGIGRIGGSLSLLCMVADPFIYSDTLTPTEVADDYYDNVLPADNLVMRLPFDEGEDLPQDTSGNANHVTLQTNMDVTSDTPSKARTAITQTRTAITTARTAITVARTGL